MGIQVFFPLAQYSMQLELEALPKEGDVIIISEKNLKAHAGGVDIPWVYGSSIIVGERMKEDLGWDGENQTFPSYACRVT